MNPPLPEQGAKRVQEAHDTEVGEGFTSRRPVANKFSYTSKVSIHREDSAMKVTIRYCTS